MLFSSGRPDAPALGLLDAALRGYPEGGGVFAPTGEADLRPLVYAPELSFTETAALGAAALFPEDIDPLRASTLAEAAFVPQPEAFSLGEEILLLDLASGPTGSAADYALRFALALLGKRAEGRIGIAALRPRDSAALAAAAGTAAAGTATEAKAGAAAKAGADFPLVLLLPEGGDYSPPPPRSGRSAPFLIAVRGRAAELRALELSCAGESLEGRPFLPLGVGSPARFAGAILLLLALFSMGRKGLSGDLLVAAPAGDDEALAAGLWAWSWGLPVSAYLRPEGLVPMERSGTELLERFPLPGALSSLVLPLTVDAEAMKTAGRELAASGCPPCGASTAFALAAAQRALAEGYRGHARVILPRFSAPRKPEPRKGEGARGWIPDATIDPRPAELRSVLASLLAARRA